MAAFHDAANGERMPAKPRILEIGILDVLDALRRGWSDFTEKPSYYAFLCLLYPVAGIVLMVWSAGADLLPLMFPLASGFALLGPVAAIGLYEISRRRELGLQAGWQQVLELRRSPALSSILAVAAVLFALFAAWLRVAQGLYTSFLGETPPASFVELVFEVLTTPAGWAMMFWGDVIGLGFAVLALALSVVAFPLLLERDVGALVAMQTSLRVFAANPVPILFWGLVIATLLVLGSIPLFTGLAIVLPVLGHTTWHLYRKLIGPEFAAARRPGLSS